MPIARAPYEPRPDRGVRAAPHPRHRALPSLRIAATGADSPPFMAIPQVAIDKGWFKAKGRDVSIPSVYLRLARSVRADRRQTLTHILLPAIRGPLLTGIRLAVRLSLVGVVLSEFFATERGLGRIVLQSYSGGDHATMMSTILLLIAISFVLSLLLWQLERRSR